MRALWLVILLTACASPQRGEYRQSAFPPGAPAFNPAWDAPHTVGQPGHIGAPESVPRSPHKRYLPPTREPGLWAGDGTRASLPEPPSVLGFAITTPPEAAPADVTVVKACADLYAGCLFNIPRLVTEIRKRTTDEQSCLVTMLVEGCVRYRSRETEKGSTLRATYGAMVAHTDNRCADHMASLVGISNAIETACGAPRSAPPGGLH